MNPNHPSAAPEHPGATFVHVRVVYNGRAFPFEENAHEPVRALFQKALFQFGLSSDGQNLLLRYNGAEVALDQKLEDLNLPQDAVFYLEPRAPSGGAAPKEAR